MNPITGSVEAWSYAVHKPPGYPQGICFDIFSDLFDYRRCCSALARDTVRCLHFVGDHRIHQLLNSKPDASGVQPSLISDAVPMPTSRVSGFSFPSRNLLGMVLVHVIPMQDGGYVLERRKGSLAWTIMQSTAGIAKAVEAAGPIDALVNNASVGWLSLFEGTSEDNMRQIFETNTFGTMELVRAVLPQMRATGSGVIVNVSSSVTLEPLPLASVYTASKAAVNAFTECLALELAPLGIRAHIVLPGQAPATNFGKNAMALMSEANETPEDYKPFVEQTMAAFMNTEGKEFTFSEDVVQAIWSAVTDSTCPLRIPAGKDSVALAA